MPASTSFDAIWRALEDALDEAIDSNFEITDQALWMDMMRGFRKYEIRLAMGDLVSATIALEQDPLNAAVDEGSLEATDDYPGGCSLLVEFCVIRENEPIQELSMLRHVIEEFWPDATIAHTRIEDIDTHADAPDRQLHEHFSFMRTVDFDFIDTIDAFVPAMTQTLEQLATIAER